MVARAELNTFAVEKECGHIGDARRLLNAVRWTTTLVMLFNPMISRKSTAPVANNASRWAPLA